MKKRCLLLFAVLLLVVCAVTLTACKKDGPADNGTCEHQWSEWAVKTAASCSAEGTEERTCALCHETDRRSISKTAHQFGTEWIGSAEGHYHKCLNCDAVSATEAHKPGPEATSASSQVCLDCGYILNHAIAHKLTKTEAVAPTCLTSGNAEYWHCEDCGANFSDAEGKNQLSDPALAPLGHTWDKEDPGCEDDLTCTVCNAVQLAKGHQYEVVATTELSCTTDATVTCVCDECGHSFTKVTENAMGHQLGAWETTGEPSRIGTTCEYTQRYHADCAHEGCPGADKTEALTIHHYGAAKETTLATCKTPGVKTYTCTDCGATRTENFEDATAHVWDGGKTVGGNTVYTCTGAGCGKTKTIYNSTTATVAKGDLSDEIALKNASLSLDETVKNKLGANTTFTAEKLSVEDLEAELGEGAQYLKQDALVFEFAMQSDGSAVGFGGGKVTVRIPYELGEDDDPDNIAVFYIDENGNLQFYTAKYVNGYAVFEAEHFSTYTVTRLTPAERCALYGHSDRDVVVKPTCEEEGYTISVCLRCRDTRKHDVKPALGHDWEIVSETKDAVDCTHSKTVVSRCKTCNEEVTEYTPALGHDWEESDRKDASCTSAGSVKKTCANCNASFTETIPQRAHNYRSEITDVTCTTDGYTTNTCTVCGHVLKNNFVTATGHNFRETVVPHTCTENGYTLMECRNCDYSCRTNETPAAHTWDRDAADCGHAQTCVICGTAGAPATGNHQMTDGICTVCGEGCVHEFVTSTVEATCEERGYLLEKCDKCGLEKKSNYTDALGHSGVADCDRCGAALISDEYFGRLLLDNQSQKFNLCLNEFVVRTPGSVGSSESVVTVRFAEMILSFTKDGVSGSAYGQITVQDGIYRPTFQFRAAILDGILYLNQEGNASSAYASESGGKSYWDEIQKIYGKISLEDLFGLLAETSATPGSVAYILSLLSEMLPDLFKELGNVQVGTENFAEAGKLVRQYVNAFCDVTRDGEDIVLSLSFEKIGSFLLCETVADMVDYVFGEGSFKAIEKEILTLGDCTVAELVKQLNDAGIKEGDVYNKANALISDLTGGQITTVEGFLSAVFGIDLGEKEDGTPVTVLDLLNQLIDSKLTLFEIVLEQMPADPDQAKPTVNDLKQAISSLFDQYGSANPLELLMSMMPRENQPVPPMDGDVVSAEGNEEETDPGDEKLQALAEAIKHYIGLLKEDISLSVIADKNAKIKSLEFSLELSIADYSENAKGSITVRLSLPTEYASKLDVQALISETGAKVDPVKLNTTTLSKFLNDKRYTLEFDENGNLVSIFFAEDFYPTDIGNWIGESIYCVGHGQDEDGTPYLIRVYSTEYYEVDRSFAVISAEDCGTTALAILMPNKVKTYGLYKYYGNGKEIVPYDGEEYDHSWDEEINRDRSYPEQLYFLYNTKTSKVLRLFTSDASSEDLSLHVWNVSETVEAIGCEGVGEIHYVCESCGKTRVKYYTNGHRNTVEQGEFLTEIRDCDAGVKISTVCLDCGKTIYTHTCNWHYPLNKEIHSVGKDALGKIGSLCGGRVTVNGCLCGEQGPYTHEEFECDCSQEVWGTLMINGQSHSAWIKVCSVTDPEPCGFVWGYYYTDRYTDGCYEYERNDYFYGAVYVGKGEDGYPIYRLTENSLVIKGDIVYSNHIPQGNATTVKAYILPSGNTVNVTLHVCSVCGEYDGSEYIENQNGNIQIYVHGKGEEYRIDAYEYFAGGRTEWYETTNKDGSLNYRRIKTLTYGTNGNRCTAVIQEWHGTGSMEERTEVGCDRYDWDWVVQPTCTGRGSYYKVCGQCGCKDDELHYSSPNGHYFNYDYELAMHVCKVCGLQSKGGMNGSILMEDLTKKGSDTFTVGYYLRESDHNTFEPYITLIAEDGRELILTTFEAFAFDATLYQNTLSFTKGDIVNAAMKEYPGITGNFRVKITFVPQYSDDKLDFAVTFDETITFGAN